MLKQPKKMHARSAKKLLRMLDYTRKEETVPLLSTMVKYQITISCHSLIESQICKLFLPNTPRFWSCPLATLTSLKQPLHFLEERKYRTQLLVYNNMKTTTKSVSSTIN